jgi:hypothetical protein
MPDSSIPIKQEDKGTSARCTSKPPITPTEFYQAGYQQALTDFAITDLLCRLKTYSDSNFDAAWMNLTQAELESLAAILIRELTTNLKGKAIASYLNAIRHGNSDIPPSLVDQAFPPPSIDLPANFPNVQTPRYLYGDKLRWISNGETTDWGVAIGRFYSFAPHCCRWRWSYLIWLAPDSPSSGWLKADVAWEDDLEPLEVEAVL